MLSDKWLQRYRLLKNSNIEILPLEDVLELRPLSPPPDMDPGVRCHGMKANPTGYLWSKYECFLRSGWEDRLLENFNTEILIFENVLVFDL